MLRKAATVTSGLVLVATCLSWVAWSGIDRLEGNLTVDQTLGGVLSPPTSAPSDGQAFTAQNILVVGTDTRSGQGPGYGSEADASGNGHSDTTLLLHIAADRRSAFVVSIPRDSWVTRPGCRSDGTTDATVVAGKFNAAFAAGGRACVIAAVKSLTHVPIDHYVEVDFKGFKSIVNALGGVTICSTEAISDPVRPDSHGGMIGSGLDIPAGESTLDGEQALALVRARYIGVARSDLERLDRQHKFLAAMVRQASSAGLLTNPVQLFDVLSQVAKSMTVDAGLSGDHLKQFLLSLQGLKPSDIKFFTVPVAPRGDGANVVWVQKEAKKIWAAMAGDSSYPPSKKTDKPGPAASGSSTTPSSTTSATSNPRSECI